MHCTNNNMSFTCHKQRPASAEHMFAMFSDAHKEGEATQAVSFRLLVARPTGERLLCCSGVLTVVTKICHVVGVTQTQ